jgi:uncharacterized Zn-binding protein involved in type VI secretion
MPNATRVGDAHVCPVHTGGPVNDGSTSVNIGGQPAARAGDRAKCSGPDDTIVQGSPTVFIDGRPAARVGDKCAHTGMIVSGCPTVNIGNEGGGGGSAPSGGNAAADDDTANTGGTGPIGGTPPPAGTPPPTTPPDNRRRAPGPGETAVPRDDQAVPRDAAENPPDPAPKSKDNEKKKSSKQEKSSPTKLSSPTLLGSPTTMETVQSLLGLVRKMYPQLDEPLSRFDPQSLQATSARLQDAIARKDVNAVNQIGSQLVALIQNGGKLPVEQAGDGTTAVLGSRQRRDNYR